MKKIIFQAFGFVLIFLNESFAGASYTLSRFDYTWCTTSYPTAYVAGNFSIIETSTANSGQDGFTKNQTLQTIILSLPAGFQFNTSGSPSITTTQNGGTTSELTIVSFAYSATTVTVTLISAIANNYLNTLDFNNFEIRANSSGSSGNILRTGGTFQIESATTNPTSTESLGILSAATPFVYVSSSVSQPNTSNVTQYSIDQDIIQIKISGTGSCGGTVTQFDFNTLGGNSTGTDLPSTNISTAKVYYTGSSSTFATTTFFGSATAPNGAFTITGSQDLTTADSYFWLTYDVPGNANTGAGSNRLDAQLVDFILSGTTITNMSTPTPVGYRPIIAATFYYSRFSGNWTTTNIWSTTSGGATCSCQPNGSGVVIVDVGHTITADATRTVDVIQINNTSTLTGGNPLTINSVLTTSGSGVFTLTAPLTAHGNVTLSGTGASSVSKMITIDGDLTINSGTSLTGSGGTVASVDQNIYIGGNLLVDGTLQQTGGKDIILNAGLGFNISGVGSIANGRTFIISGGSKNIASGSTLTITPPCSIQGAYSVTNNGTITLQDNLDGTNNSARWINATGSVLNYGGSANIFVTSGGLTASASNNTVNYNGATAQTIVYPNAGQYNNLTLAGSLTKTLAADILVSGNWINNVAFAHNNQGVTFNGTTPQTISGSSIPTFYDFTLNNSNGLTLSQPANISHSLSLTSGLLNTTSSNILTLQNGAIAPALTAASTSYVNGPMKYQKATAGSTILNFPIGKSPDCRPVILTANHADVTLYNYTGESFNADPWATFGSGVNDMPATCDTISGVHYVTIARTDNAGTSQPSNGLSGNQTIQMFFGTNDFVYQGSTLTIVKNTAATPATWIDIGGTSSLGNFNTPQAGSVTSTSSPTAFNSFSSFALGSTVSGWNSLPIELLDFSAIPNKEKVDLKWTTTTETNNKNFAVEKSKDGINFTWVMNVPGAGNSLTLKEYFESDYNPYEGVSYYRLKQTDYNGSFKYSQIVSVTFGAQQNILVYPNPSNKNESVNISIKGYKGQEVLVVLRDINGRDFYSKIFVAEDNNQLFLMDAFNNIPAGTYIVIASSVDKVYHQKITIR